MVTITDRWIIIGNHVGPFTLNSKPHYHSRHVISVAFKRTAQYKSKQQHKAVWPRTWRRTDCLLWKQVKLKASQRCRQHNFYTFAHFCTPQPRFRSRDPLETRIVKTSLMKITVLKCSVSVKSAVKGSEQKSAYSKHLINVQRKRRQRWKLPRKRKR